MRSRPAAVGAIAVALATVAAPLATAQQAPAASPERLAALVDATRREPASLPVVYELVRVAVEVGDLETAIGALERLLLFNPDQPRVRLELGVLYFRLGAYDLAALHLERARGEGEALEGVAERAAPFLAEIARRSARHRLDVVATTAVRHQTNPSATADPTDLRVGDLDVAAGGDEKSDQSVVAAATLVHSFRPHTQWGDAWVTRLDAYAERFRDQTRLDFAIADLETGPRVGLGRLGRDGATLRPLVSLGYATLDDAYYLARYGVGLEVQQRLAPTVLGTLRGRLREHSFTETDRRAYGDRSGRRDDLSLTVTWAPASCCQLDAFGYAEHAEARENFRGYTELGLGLTYAHRLELGAAAVGPLTLYGGLGLARARYDARDPVIEADTRRIDRTVDARAGALLDIAAAVALTAEVQHRRVASRIGIYEFDNTASLVGLQVRF